MLTIRRAAAADQPQLMAIYRTAQEYMLQTGNPTQWGRSYPSPELIRSDIAQGICRVLSDEAGIHGVFALLDTPEPTYSRIEGAWRNDAPYLTIHRLAGDEPGHTVSSAVLRTTARPFPGMSERIPTPTTAPCSICWKRTASSPAARSMCGTERPGWHTIGRQTARDLYAIHRLAAQHSPIQHAKRPGASCAGPSHHCFCCRSAAYS